METPPPFRAARRVQLQQQQQARARVKHHKLRASLIGYTVVLVFLAALQFIGVYLFAKGFLLTRLVLPDLAETAPSGFETPRFKRAVVLVVDALRFDFTIPVAPEHAAHDPHCHNHFTVLHEMARVDPRHAVLLKFLADPPTTTLQRLKGLTTGLLPTFVDAGLNFAGTAVIEDNWVAQLHARGRRVAFMGDDTWAALYGQCFVPELFFPYDSLNVWDLHSVDNGVLAHLDPLLSLKRTAEWDVLVGHFLGVDHAGHRYGPSHPAMGDKLHQMNTVIAETAAKIDDDTLLVVFGDHGMDRTGNHGGDSRDELESTLFLYSKAREFTPRPLKEYNTADLGAGYRAVDQIDLVPTLSLLLGLPIPFNNLGFPIDEAFLSPREHSQAALLTAQQLARYQSRSLEAQTDEISFEGVAQGSADLPGYAAQVRIIQRAFLDHCKSLWARFDMISIGLGIAVLILALTVVTTYSRLIPSVRVLTMSFEFIGSIVAMSLLGLVLSLSIYIVLRPPVPLKTCLLCGTAAGITIGFWAPIMDRFSVLWLWHQLVDFFVYNFNMWSLICLVFVAFHCMMFASNSFVVWEDKMVDFFVATFGACCLVGIAISSLPRRLKILGVMHALTFVVLSRIVGSINLCREEQMPYCTPSFATTRWTVGLLYLAAFILPKIIKSFYNLLDSYHSAAPLWIESGLSLMMLMNAVYWTLELFENDGFLRAHLGSLIDSGLLKSVKLAIARIAQFSSIILANFSWSRGPLCVKIEFAQADSVTEAVTGGVDDENSLSQGELVPAPQKQATILGYGNVYGSSYFLLVLNLFVAILLVTKPTGALSLCILIVQILTLLELYDLLELRRNLIAPVMFGLLGYQHFFSTGHQATIPSIQWEVGFMTTQTIFFPFTHLNIFLNTFGSFLIVCLSIPLISLWKIPPSAKPITVLSQVVTNITTLLTYQVLTSILSFVFAANFRRHLMVWKIFAPRFMLSALLLIVLNVTLAIFTAWFATGRLLMQVNRIFGR